MFRARASTVHSRFDQAAERKKLRYVGAKGRASKRARFKILQQQQSNVCSAPSSSLQNWKRKSTCAMCGIDMSFHKHTMPSLLLAYFQVSVIQYGTKYLPGILLIYGRHHQRLIQRVVITWLTTSSSAYRACGLSRMKNGHEHGVCWMSPGIKNGLLCKEHNQLCKLSDA